LKFPNSLSHDHSPQEIQRRLDHSAPAFYLKDFIYGGVDGIITTFAIVAGVTGANLSQNVILILGMSNIIADGFSMAASNYLGTKAELDRILMLKAFEEHQIDKNPKGEEEEIRQILLRKRVEGQALESTLQKIIQDKQAWVKMMLIEEYGVQLEKVQPFKSALTTFVAFMLMGLLPLLPYLLFSAHQFRYTIIATGLAFFGLGALKARWSQESPWMLGLKTLGIGAFAALLAYMVGHLLQNLA
jgi:vacuolar iron transporter family protein